MRIAIIGSGNIGAGLAKAWAARGHAVTFGARHPDDAELRSLCAAIGARAVSVSDAGAGADVIVLATPWGALSDVLARLGPCAGKIVIDCTNAVGPSFQLQFGHTTSSAEELQKKIPEAHVFKSFNAQGVENLENPVYGGVRASNFFCGDDARARVVVKQLVEEVGFEAVDAGPLTSARQIEPLMILWITMARRLGTRDIAFKLLRR